MRVLQWYDLFYPYLGGIEKLALGLLPALAAEGHEFRIVTSHHNLDLPDEARFAGIPVRRFPFRRALSGDAAAWRAAQEGAGAMLRDFAPRLVHLQGLGPSALFCRRLLGRPGSPPLLVSLHQELGAAQRGAAGGLTREVLSGAAWVSAVSRGVLEQALALVPGIAGRSSVVHNFVEDSPLPRQPLPWTPPRLLCLGRTIRQKGFDLALSAFASLRGRWPGLAMTVAGDGDERPGLERQAAAAGLAGAVEFTGGIAPPDVPALLDRATVVLMPSRVEGFGLVAVEAALRERPIVAAGVGGLVDVVADGETGLLVPPEDERALAHAVSRLLAEPPLAVRLGVAARARARDLFGKEACVRGYAEIYARLGGELPAAAPEK